jgi:aromatic-L-amino-acid/L-tryptophan decarboxylase
LWFHIDGAYGALAMLAPDLAPKLRGIERADSLAFDFHKWGQVPYDAGFLLGSRRRSTAECVCRLVIILATRNPRAGRRIALALRLRSRSFAWLSRVEDVVHAEGLRHRSVGSVISRTCALARYLEQRIASTPELELLAPVELNIVCFRYRADDADSVNEGLSSSCKSREVSRRPRP